MARVQDPPYSASATFDPLGVEATRPRLFARESLDQAAGILGERTDAIPAYPADPFSLGINKARRSSKRSRLATYLRLFKLSARDVWEILEITLYKFIIINAAFLVFVYLRKYYG